MPAKDSSPAGKILHNSFWFGLETVLETLIFIGTSIAVARYLGPRKLGYFSYINFFVTVVTQTSGIGLANATRKYMSEFLALGQAGEARAVYKLAYRYQLLGAVSISVVGILSIFLFGEPGFKLMSAILILSITPGVMSWVPASANMAFEDVSKNTLSAFCYILTYTTVIVLTVHFHWDLIGVASALLIGRTVEVILRTIPLNRRLRELPLASLSTEITSRIRRFCLQAFGLQLLMSVVWDRSEMIFLRAFCSLDQIAFYSVSFGLANNLLLIPRTFGGATGITLMVEASREPGNVGGIVLRAVRYLLLVVIPINFGTAAITRELIGVTYGDKYLGAIPVLIIASVLCVPRAFHEISETLVRAADRQNGLLVWLALAGVLNISLDALLIPLHGAVGAALANGLSQTFGVIAVWQLGRRCYNYSFPVQGAIRFAAAGVIMATVAYLISHHVRGVTGIVLAILTAAPVYVLAVKLIHALNPSDRPILNSISSFLPGFIHQPFEAVINFATPVDSAVPVSEEC